MHHLPLLKRRCLRYKMYRTEGVLALLALYLGVAHCFSWDVVVAGDKQLEFYDSNGTRTHIEDIPSHWMNSIAYDPVHTSVLFVDQNNLNFSISSFNIATREINLLVRSKQYGYVRIAYEPDRQLLFWTETGSDSKNSIVSKSGRILNCNGLLKANRQLIGYTNAVDQKLLIKLDGDEFIHSITVDSCGGYIYWTTDSKIERARFDGSGRQVVIDKNVYYRGGIAIDHHTRKMYWLDNQNYDDSYQLTIESADLNGENTSTLYIERDTLSYRALLVTKDFIYWRTHMTFSQLTRNPPHDKEVKPKQFLLAQSSYPVGMAYNYKIEDLRPIDLSQFCVHGTKVNGKSRCECTQGYIGERCDVSVCHNYCFHGDCSVSAEGQPKCRCKAGYSGERCAVYVCHKYCSNNGVCSLNEESEPLCQCAGDYEGERCDVPVFIVKCLQTLSLVSDILNTDVSAVTLGKGVKSTYASTVV